MVADRTPARGSAGSGAEPPDPDRLFAIAYEELRALARRQLRGEGAGHTLQPTALVNEAWMKLAAHQPEGLSDRAHFVAVAGRAMRQVLVDYARRRAADKRGGGAAPTTLSGKGLGSEVRLDDVLALDRALDRLGELDERLRRVVEYKFFAGLTDAETARILGVTPRTVGRDWVRARAWLHAELYASEAGDG